MRALAEAMLACEYWVVAAVDALMCELTTQLTLTQLAYAS
jgi:hypothetical protein